MSPPTKSCEKCGESFAPSKYTARRQRFCSEQCARRQYEANNREMMRAKSRRWRKAHPDKARDIRRRADLKRNYGLTPEDYERMLSEQDGRCAVCRAPAERAATREGGYLCVDHDHVTGKVRGLLCGNCNAILGYAEDSPTILRSALHYLEETTYAAALD